MIVGKNPILLNTTYIRPSKDDPKCECFEVIYKTDTGEVLKSNEPAEGDIYIVKPEFRNYSYNKPEERIEKMNKVRCQISKIRQTIAAEAGEWGTNIINASRDNLSLMNQLYKWPYCYGCDFQPEYYYMKNWYEKYPLNDKNIKLSVAFLDIETDLIDYSLDMDDIPNTAVSPVNLVTVIMEETNESCTFILRPYEPSKFGRSEDEYKERYMLYQNQLRDHNYLMSHMREFIKDLHQSFDPVYGFINYHIREFEKEIDLIASVFQFINDRKPNFCLSWNMRFDIQYLYYRIMALHKTPSSVMCHPDFPRERRRCAFKVDRSTFLLEKQYDYFYCSTYTQYICQMRLYASIRRSQHKLKSVSLNAIGDRELKDRKVEYPEATNMRRFPYVDWIKFIKYNIKDVLLQKGIERKTKDVMTYYMRSHVNLTPYNKIFKETHLLRNVREIYFEKEGWVQGNNINIIDNPEEDEQAKRFYGLYQEDEEGEASFKGAINADPVWNDSVGMKVFGTRTNNIFPNAMDYDMGAFYPSIKIACNMDPITLKFKASFINDEFISGEFINRSLNTQYVEKDKNGNTRKLDFTGEAVNTYASKNILTFGYNYLGLPSITSVSNEILRRMRG